MEINITIEGARPLLMNRFHEQAAEDASAGSRGSSAAAERGTPHEQCGLKLYKDPDGVIAIPSWNIMKSIADGGRFHKIGKKQVTTREMSLVYSAVQMHQLWIPVVTKFPWEIDERPIVNPTTRGRRLTWRPRFNDWKLTFTLRLSTRIFGPKLLRKIVNDGGELVGLGEARVIGFGRYQVINWQETQEDLTADEETPLREAAE